MINDLKKIKKLYGEKMMHLCRELFSTLLEEEGLLSNLLIDNFAPTKFLYNDIIQSKNVENFKNYIYNLVDVEKKEQQNINKTPKELLEEVGYNLYECKTEEDIQTFKKYYEPGEELCTFYNDRLNRCFVFFAVKKNVDEIKRKNFKYPRREDEYGISVISIQFTRGEINTLSIKNRYNHRVNNPDATYSNNLENIIEGLTESFEKEYNLNINQNNNGGFELRGYVKANDGKYYKYNYEIDNIYYCPNNIIIDNFEVKKLEPEKYIVIDYFIVDLVKKEVKLYDNRIKDCFLDEMKNIEKIKIIQKNEKENKEIQILTKDQNEIIIELDKINQIIGYKNSKVKEIKDNFLYYNENLSNLELVNLQRIGNDFLEFNKKLTSISLLNLNEIGDKFLNSNFILNSIDFPKLKKIGSNFLRQNIALNSIDFPNLEDIGDSFIANNDIITNINLPNLQKVGTCFLYSNMCITDLDLPKLRKAKDYFLYFNDCIKTLSLPNLQQVEDYFLRYNKKIINLNLPNLEKVGIYFLCYNDDIEFISLEKLKETQPFFLQFSKKLKYAYFPNLNEVDKEYLKTIFYNTTFFDEEMYKKYIKSIKKTNLEKIQQNSNETLNKEIKVIKK